MIENYSKPFVHPELTKEEVTAGWTWSNYNASQVSSHYCSNPDLKRVAKKCFNRFGNEISDGTVSVLFCGTMHQHVLTTGQDDLD